MALTRVYIYYTILYFYIYTLALTQYTSPCNSNNATESNGKRRGEGNCT